MQQNILWWDIFYWLLIMKISSGITCLIVHGIILQWPSIITKILNWIFLAPCSCNPRGVLTFDTLVCHWPWTKVTYNFTFRLPSIHTRQTSIKFRMQQQGLCSKLDLRNLTTSILFLKLCIGYHHTSHSMQNVNYLLQFHLWNIPSLSVRSPSALYSSVYF